MGYGRDHAGSDLLGSRNQNIYLYSCESTRIEELPANGHGETVTKFAKEATCKMEGYTGDLYCMDCGELLEEGSVIEKLPHQWDAGKITKKATTSTTGIRTYTCTK